MAAPESSSVLPEATDVQPAPGSRGRGSRGCGGRGSRRSSLKGKPPSSQLNPPVKTVEPTIPKPQNKSKTSTPLSNDPLYLDALVIEGDQGFVEETGHKVFSPTFESYVSLVERTYAQVCTADKEFQRHISLAMYLHYHIVHLYARIAVIRQHGGKATEDENNLVRYLQSVEYSVHEPINCYLRGIGNFIDTSGTMHRFSIRQLPQPTQYEGITGFFGRVDQNTHTLYECYPSPGVVATRIVEDYLYSNDRNRNPIWNISAAIRPQEQVQAGPQDEEQEAGPNEGDDPIIPFEPGEDN